MAPNGSRANRDPRDVADSDPIDMDACGKEAELDTAERRIQSERTLAGLREEAPPAGIEPALQA